MKTQQYLLILLGILLATGLYFFGKTTAPGKTASTAEVHNTSKPAFSFQDYESARRSRLQPSFVKALDSATSDTARSRIWESYSSPALSAWYFYKFAREHKHAHLLEDAGDRFVNAARTDKDTSVSINCYTFALRSYEEANSLASGDPDLVVKLAEVYVNSSAEPMKGIALLRDLADSLPGYSPAQVMLGRFAIVSGQYDKAKERLEKVLNTEPGNTEAMYFLAFAEEGLGNNERAIALLEQCKLLVRNPGFDKEINDYIKNIKSK